MTTPRQGWQRLGFRADVEGLRAVAVLAVLAYHTGMPLMSGGFVGVDVFFVISGFLITGLLADELWANGRISLVAFYARRARRLLPAVFLVLVATAIASAYALSPINASIVVGDIVAAAFYVANIRFALQRADYLAGERDDSPVLHLWSLGVEEQFYLVWPLLVVVAGALALRRGGASDVDRRNALLGSLALVLGVVGLASLAASLSLVRVSQPWAFFGMPTRAWEFALGASVALADRRGLVLGASARRIAAWTAAPVLLGSCVLITPLTPFPGVAALAPALATAALLAAGSVSGGASQPPPGPVTVLALAPMRFIGQRSYSLYLWHWPAVVLAQAALGDLHWHLQAAVVLASAVPAVLAYSLVEAPVHRAPLFVRSSRRSLTLGAATTAGAVLAGVGLGVLSPLVRGPVVPVEITPTPALAMRDLPAVYASGCHLDFGAIAPSTPCAYGEVEADREMVLFGDSHAAQWFPTLDALAKGHGLRLLSWTKSSCPSADVAVWHLILRRWYTQCDAWREAMLTRIETAPKPALVVLSNYRPTVLVDPATGEVLDDAGAAQAWRAGLERVLARIARAEVPVLLIRDTPRPNGHVASCVSENMSSPERCDFDRAGIPAPEIDVAIAGGIDGVTVADLTEHICLPGHCPAVRDGILVFRDHHHLTATYAELLAGALDERVAPLVTR